jgi:uncharacterized protein (TIGR02246 family)
MFHRYRELGLAALFVAASAACAIADNGLEKADIEAVQKLSAARTAAFNAGKVDELASNFLPSGELIDEAGTIYHGPQEIRGLLMAFFEQFPGSKLSANIESIRIAGPVAIEEGARSITTQDGKLKSQFRYIAVLAKTSGGWKLASYRDFSDDPPPTPHDYLAPLAWLVGDWINEGADGKVAINYRWSDDKNFLLGTYEFNAPGGKPRRSVQRLGWDPSSSRIRSWLFDADGGFSEGAWTVADDGVVIKSTSVNPDGSTSSATMEIVPDGKDRFTISGSDRIVGDTREADFEITVVRRPVAAGK